MATKLSSDVDTWLKRETDHVRKALESASRHFDGNDNLTVNTLETVYARESSFGSPAMLGKRGSSGAAGHFQFRPDTAKRYGLNVLKNNDQRFDIDYASSAAARYLKDLHTFFSKDTTLIGTTKTIGIKNLSERKKFVLGAFNAGEGNIAKAQRLAQKAGKDPQLWAHVEEFLESAGASKTTANEARQYVKNVPLYESEFASKSPADKNIKQKEPRKGNARCTEGRWRTIDDRRVFICD
ncbi:MAG: transglycosylase SLT domain-containing protein [Candidatus Omnitrophica bacterium]|nr:transglycosylase SLT domain-containing protein [Candidatus Omnitrophota bacterium]